MARPPMWVGLFYYHFMHIYMSPTPWGRISTPVTASINAVMKGVVSEQTRRKGDIVTNSKETLKKRADARFKTSRCEKARRQCWIMRPRVAPFAKKPHG